MNNFEQRLESLKEKAKSLCPKNLPSGYTQIFLSDGTLRKYLRVLDERPIRTYREIWEDWFTRSLKKSTQLPRGADFMEFIAKEPTVDLKVQKKAENNSLSGYSGETQGNTKDKRQVMREEILGLISEKITDKQKYVFEDYDCIDYYIDEVLIKKEIEIPYNNLFDDWLKIAADKGYQINSRSFKQFMSYLKPPKKEKSVSRDQGINKTNRAFLLQENHERRYQESWVRKTWLEIKDSDKWKGKDTLAFYQAYEKGELEQGELIAIEHFKKEVNPPPAIPVRTKDLKMDSTATLVAYSDYVNEIKNNIRLKLIPEDTEILSLKDWFES